MGKIIKKIRNRNKYSPASIANDLMNPNDLEETTSAGSDVLDSIREHLLNSNIEEKLNGLQSLALFINNNENITAICNSDLIRIVAPLLCEKDLAVRNAAAGALRNLSVFGPEVCTHMTEQDVTTPLLVLLNEYDDLDWKPVFNESMQNELDLRSDVFLQIVNLLWNLCESTSIALDAFNQTQLFKSFIRCLNFEEFGLQISISVAQCMLVLSENNPKVWATLNEKIKILLHLLTVSGDADKLYIRSLSAGIISNVPALSAAYSTQVLTSLVEILAINHFDHINDFLNDVSTAAENRNEKRNGIQEMDVEQEETEEEARIRRRRQELPSEIDIRRSKVVNLLDAQRVAAEIITNLLSPEDEEEWDDEDDENLEDEITFDGSDNELSTSGDNNLPIEIIEIIQSTGLVQKLWEKCQPIPDETCQSLRSNSTDLLIKVKNLRISSLLCLQNLFNILTCELLGGANVAYNIWVTLGQLALKEPQNTSILEPITSLMRSALQHLKAEKELFKQMNKDDLELILAGVQECGISEIRANWLRMLGILGSVIDENLVQHIIAFIVKACEEEEDVWAISEGLDALMDMFADNDWDELVAKLNLHQALKKLNGIFKNKMRQQKRELNERYPAVQTVAQNFSRFLKYIEKQSANSGSKMN